MLPPVMARKRLLSRMPEPWKKASLVEGKKKMIEPRQYQMGADGVASLEELSHPKSWSTTARCSTTACCGGIKYR
ncbi:hypothetical protein HPP92_012386 [Vanilla planifolia]|uniref:Uncharacterized protein n=1 Tax=Vanilla planifolia TaxID=51239 RepID=A0A835UXH6_VANPL|nr:hypothetical protein HPP92_012386 [Vanilla planifolia]